MSKTDIALAKDMGKLASDPYKWVMYAYDWNHGLLEGFKQPDDWQAEILDRWGHAIRKNGFDGVHAVDPLQFATSSGHGIGKSALTAWIAGFIMSTRPYCSGVITANTHQQLKTKTWSELIKWNNLSITGHWFKFLTSSSLRMHHVDYPQNWKLDGVTCVKENSESFAGLHAANSTPFFIFDEASGIPDIIWEVAEGGLTDGEPFWFTFGNPTQPSGRFFECFNRQKHRWSTRQIDSRTVKITNKKKIQEWLEDWGEDSDFFRVRVRGLFPRSGSSQIISSQDVFNATRRELKIEDFKDFPRLLGVDVARFGEDESVIVQRQGMKVYSPQSFRKIDTQDLASRTALMIEEWKPDAVFIDGVGVGAGVIDRLNSLGYRNLIIEVQASGKAADKKYANKTSECWGKMAEWFKKDVEIPDCNELVGQLTSRQYGFNVREQIQLERKGDAKKRGLSSPDRADALALTFAENVRHKNDKGGGFLQTYAMSAYDMISGKGNRRYPHNRSW